MKPEDSLHITIADWLMLKYPKLLWWHTPNGGMRVNKKNKQGDLYSPEANKLKRMGVKAGVPDIFIPLANGEIFDGLYEGYFGFFAELKIKPNKLTGRQEDVIEQLTDLGYYCCVCYTLDDFIKQWETYNL